MPQDELITRQQAALLPPPCSVKTIIRAEQRGELDPVTRGRKRGKGIPVFLRKSQVLSWKGGLVAVLVLFLGYTLLTIACRAGFGPARAALKFITGNNAPFCVKTPGHHHHRKGIRLYAVSAEKAPRGGVRHRKTPA